MVTAATILVIIGLIATGRWGLVAKKAQQFKLELVPVGVLLGCCLVLFLVRLPLAFEHYAFTPDMASYLTTRNYVLGTDYSWPPGLHTRPPLIGLVLVPLTFLFGDLWGSKLLALGVGVGLALPIYILARHWLRPWWAFAAALIAIIQPYNAMYTIGGYLPLVALFFCLLALRALLDRSWWALFLTFIMAGFNGTIIPIYAVAGFVLVGSEVLPTRGFHGSAKTGCRGFVILIASGLVMLPWLYWYLQMPASPVFPGPLFSLSQFPETLIYAGWVVVFLPGLFIYRESMPLGVLCAIFAVTSNVLSANNMLMAVLWRTHYMVPVFLVIGSMYLFERGLVASRRWYSFKRFHARAKA